MMNQAENFDEVRIRLIHAAAALFARRGLAGTSVREITDLAGANLASVNYYFGSKERLYVETLRHMFLDMGDMHERARSYLESAKTAADHASAVVALRAFIEMFVENVAATGPQYDLILREMVEPTGALEHIFREFIWPLAAALDELVRLVRPSLANDPRRLDSYCASIVAQCLHVRQQQNMDRAQNLPPPTPEHIRWRATHIADFCLRALE